MKRSLFDSSLLLFSLLLLYCFSCTAVGGLPSTQYPYGGLSLGGEEEYRRFSKDNHVAISIMPLGDSITEGTSSGVRERQFMAAYRKALWDKLHAAGYEIHFVGSQMAGEAIPDFEPHHEGHSGWTADQIAANIFNWLHNNPAEIVLLHIGTNDISRMNEDPRKVEDILEEIDRYSADVWVVLARIVNRRNHVCSTSSWKEIFDETTRFNNELEAMALTRIKKGDKIIIVDMECGTNLNYLQYPYGDMWDELHPYRTGYTKMAETWFSALEKILPIPTTRGADQP
jgi:lysophospholipase L1-like esterase